MSRWLSRTVPASARRAGRAEVIVSCACACTVMMSPGFYRSHMSLSCPACLGAHEM